MRLIEDYKQTVCQADRHKNPNSKLDLIYLIRKFLRNNDGGVPTYKRLMGIDKKVLYMIWIRHKPSDLYDIFYKF